MTTTTSAPRRTRRAPGIIFSAAVAVGLWLGLTAPTVSPVAPPPPPSVVVPASAPVAGGG